LNSLHLFELTTKPKFGLDNYYTGKKKPGRRRRRNEEKEGI